MAVRQGMTDLIQLLRQFTETTTNDYTLGSETYWSNEHLQDVLDRHRYDVHSEALVPIPTYEAGVTVYRDYYFRHPYVERDTSGSAVWQLRDSGGNPIGTADYARDYQARLLRFNTNTNGGLYYLHYRFYDVYRAAAEIWRLKAANVASRFDIETDNHKLKRSDLRKAYLDMAAHYEQMAASGASGIGGGQLVRMRRIDLNG